MFAMGSPPGFLSFAIRCGKCRQAADVADAAAIRLDVLLRSPLFLRCSENMLSPWPAWNG